MHCKPLLCVVAAATLSLCPGGITAQTADAPAFVPEINSADFTEMVKTLSSDAFEGRAPSSPGEELTVNYVRDQMKRIGLQPGYNGSWFQNVAMTVTTADPKTALRVTQNGTPYTLGYGTDMVIGTRTGRTEVKIDNSEMIFVGYGVDAPERNWNDYTGQDWKGKTVVMFVNDPGFHVDDDSLFDGKRMTYYGRWTYKFEEAARKGAAAALIVHDTAGAAYGWDVVKSTWTGPQYDLTIKDDPEPRLPAQGWLTTEAARALFARAGLDLQQAYKDASTPGFKPVPLKARLWLDLKSTTAEKSSRNVLGVLPGSDRADEAVVYMAHWDHLGKRPDGSGDTIYNGAVDNATGMAGILEIAGAMVTQSPRPRRSVLFLAVTLEESGLLGSKFYVNNPTFPLNKIAGVINIDAMPVFGRARTMTVTGFGSSELEDILKPLAATQGRTLRSEVAVQNGSYFRSDHFSFAKAGVPAMDAAGGEDLREGGTEAGRKAREAFYRDRYHRPQDEYDAATWKLDGVIEDLNLLYGVGRELADGSAWPNWYKGNPFKAKRDEMMKDRAADPR